MSGWFAFQPSHQSHTRVVASCTTAYTLENTTNATPVMDIIVPGGTVGTSGGLRLFAIGEYVNDTTAINCYTVRVQYGAGCQVAAFLTSALSAGCERAVAMLTTHVVAAGSTSSLRSFGRFDYGTQAASAGSSRVGSAAISGHLGVATDSTADQVMRMTVQLSSVVGCVRFVLHSAHIERVSGG